MPVQIKKALISGGGTGGHIFPAIAIANALKRRYPEIIIQFVGASDRMEMQKFLRLVIRSKVYGLQDIKEGKL